MNMIKKILKENNFTPEEEAAFMEIINEAKLLQRTTMLEDLKPFIEEKVNEIACNDYKKH